MGQVHVDDMTLEILCTNLLDFRAKSVGAVSKNVFEIRAGGCDLA